MAGPLSDHLRVVSESVEYGRGELFVAAKDFGPLSERQVGGHQHAGFS